MRKMPSRLTEIELRTLTALAAMGPCSNKALADALGWPPAEVYRIVYRLRLKGMANYGYDATTRGRELVRRRAKHPKQRSLFATNNEGE